MATAPQVPPRRPAFTLWGLIEVGGLLGCVATFAAFFGRLWWMLELTCHLRVHLAVVLAVLAGMWAFKRRWPVAALCGACAAVNALLVAWLHGPAGGAPSASDARLRLAAINVHTANERHDRVLDFLRAADVDVILLMEVNDRWMGALSPLAVTHPHRVAEPREDNFGIALFSRLPLTNPSVLELGNAGVPSIAATVSVAGRGGVLLGTHPLPPGSAAYARLRNEQLDQIAATVRNLDGPVVVLGDLNVTPWSPYFRRLLRDSGLNDSSRGRGLAGRWPAGLPFGRILLDHGLVSTSIQVADRRLGPPVGGDHLPLVLELLIPTAARL